MKPISLPERAALAERLRSSRHATARDVTKEFLERHPDWLERYGSRAVDRGEEDAVFHLEFLAAALEAGSSAAFERYARWCSGMLESRGISSKFVMENFEQIGSSLRTRFSPEEMEIVDPLIRAGCVAIVGRPPVLSAELAPNPLLEQQEVFLQAILSPNRQAAAGLALGALHAGHSIEEIYLHMFQESLYEVGRLWESNTITVAQEHMATAITQSVMAVLYERIERAGKPRGKMVITGVEGELHQIGANMVADVLEADGWDVIFLGTNTPHSGVLTALESHRATVLGISATVLFNIPKVVSLVKATKERWPVRPPRILLGGSAFRQASSLIAEVGADAAALDLAEALAVTRSWQAGPSG
jgi:methanogenic corrinoid protein MtbC1